MGNKMIYCDFGVDGIVLRNAVSIKRVNRYVKFDCVETVPIRAMYKATTIIEETSDRNPYWYKNPHRMHTHLSEDELKQFFFQKLASTHFNSIASL